MSRLVRSVDMDRVGAEGDRQRCRRSRAPVVMCYVAQRLVASFAALQLGAELPLTARPVVEVHEGIAHVPTGDLLN